MNLSYMYCISRKMEVKTVCIFGSYCKVSFGCECSNVGSRRLSFKSLLFMAVQVKLCEVNEFCQNGHELYCSVAISAENLKQQDNRVLGGFPIIFLL